MAFAKIWQLARWYLKILLKGQVFREAAFDPVALQHLQPGSNYPKTVLALVFVFRLSRSRAQREAKAEVLLFTYNFTLKYKKIECSLRHNL
jgi:hypothetical protein